MPDLLLFGDHPKSTEAIENLARNLSFRVKTTFGISTARKWLRTGDFDAFCLHSSAPFDVQEELAGTLWEKNPLAQFIVFSFQSQSPADFTAQRLFGAHLALGDRALEVIRKTLSRTPRRGFVRSSEVELLVVEDLDSPRDIVCSYIERLGYPKVIGVRSAREALQLIAENPQRFSCVLTDLRMPDTSGLELIEKLRASEHSAQIPIVVLTAYGSAQHLVDCIMAGASGFLTKPPKKSDLLREIQRAVRISVLGGDPRLLEPSQEETLRELLNQRGIV